MAALAADGQRQVIPLGVIFANQRAGFHEVGHDAGIDDRYLGDRMRLGEGRLGRFLVAERYVEQHVAGMIGPDLRRPLLHGIDHADHRRQRGPVDLDRLDRVAGLIDGVSDNERDGVADVAHLALGEDRINRAGERIDFQIEQARQGAEILHVVSRQNRTDTRQAAGASHIDGEFRVRMRRAKHQRVHRSLRRVVIGVATFAANKRIVFLAKHALTDAKLDGSHHFSNCNLEFAPYCSGSRRSANGFNCEPATAASPCRTTAGSTRHRPPRRRRSAITAPPPREACPAAQSALPQTGR